MFACFAKARYLQPPSRVRIAVAHEHVAATGAYAPSGYCTPLSAAAADAEAGLRRAAGPLAAAAAPAPEGSSSSLALRVRFEAPARALTPGQALVLYDADGEVCLGGGVIRHAGPSLWEAGEALPQDWAEA